MILFLQDITPDIMFDHRTNNKSFIKMHLILKKMGIKNNKFFLALTQPELSGIDPHNLPSNSLQLEKKIAYECFINPWYYLREVIRIPEIGNAKGVPFELNRGNLALAWLYFNNIDVMLTIPRQIGKTMSSLGIHSYYLFLAGYNLTLALLTKDDKLRVKNISDLKNIRDLIPKYLIYKSKTDTNNTQEVSYKALNNRYEAYIAQKSIMGAEELGRGMTIATQLWDEVAYFRNIHITYPAAISSTNAAVEAAKLNNQPYGNMLTTTAGKLETKEGRFAYNLVLKSLAFSEHLYDTENIKKLKDLVNKNSKQGMVYCDYTFLQLGKSIEWFREKSRRSSGTRDSIKRDYLGIWTYGSTESAVSDKILNIIRKSKKDPTFIQEYNSFIIKWYIDNEKMKSIDFSQLPMVIGSDPSENVGEDFFSFIFLDPIDMSVIASCRCNTVNVVEIGLFIVDLLVTFTKSLLIIERNSTGVAILDVLFIELPKKGINPFRRLYNNVIQNIDLPKYKDINIDDYYVYGTLRKEFGFRLTGGNTTSGRTFIYKTVFFEALNYTATKMHDQDLINEICDLKKKNGRIDHGLNKHDDLVIAFIYACYFLLYGKNLKYYTFYKPIKNQFMSGVKNTIDMTEDHSESLLDIEKVNRMIVELNKKIDKEKIPTNKIKHMHQLLELKSMINSDENSKTVFRSKQSKTFDGLNKQDKPIENKSKENKISFKPKGTISDYFKTF